MIVKVIVTRNYFKSTTVEVEVPNELATKKEIGDFITSDTKSQNEIEESISAANLNGGDDEFDYEIPQ